MSAEPREIAALPNLESGPRNPSSERMPMVGELVRDGDGLPRAAGALSSAQSGRPYGATYVVWVGQRVVFHGWRPNKKYAWRAVNHYLDGLNVAAEVRAEIVP